MRGLARAALIHNLLDDGDIHFRKYTQMDAFQREILGVLVFHEEVLKTVDHRWRDLNRGSSALPRAEQRENDTFNRRECVYRFFFPCKRIRIRWRDHTF